MLHSVQSESGEIDYDEFMDFLEEERSPFSGQLRRQLLLAVPVGYRD